MHILTQMNVIPMDPLNTGTPSCRSAENCAKLADYLARHPLVKKVNYAGLPGHPGYDIHQSQATSGGALLSFETGNVEASKVRRCDGGYGVLDQVVHDGNQCGNCIRDL